MHRSSPHNGQHIPQAGLLCIRPFGQHDLHEKPFQGAYGLESLVTIIQSEDLSEHSMDDYSKVLSFGCLLSEAALSNVKSRLSAYKKATDNMIVCDLAPAQKNAHMTRARHQVRWMQHHPR